MPNNPDLAIACAMRSMSDNDTTALLIPFPPLALSWCVVSFHALRRSDGTFSTMSSHRGAPSDYRDTPVPTCGRATCTKSCRESGGSSLCPHNRFHLHGLFLLIAGALLGLAFQPQTFAGNGLRDRAVNRPLAHGRPKA